MSIDIRPGRDTDLPQLLEIYNHHVRHSYATFDETEAMLGERPTSAPHGSSAR